MPGVYHKQDAHTRLTVAARMVNHPVTARILILARQPETARAWSAALAGGDCHLWLAREDVPNDAAPELLLTDLSASEIQLPGNSWATADGPVPLGVVCVGHMDDEWCDVRLPPEPAPGELRLACRLLAEVIRLRRREEAAARMHDHLRQKAMSDALTDLPNRRAWDEVLTHQTAAARGAGRDARLCVAVADLDHFKRVNDTEGHAAGDRVLTAAGESLRAGLREADFVARLGGDEFGMLLAVPDAATAAMVLDRLRQMLPRHVERTTGLRVTTSIGWSLVSREDESPETTFALADTALREAKLAGRDCVRGGGTP